MKIGYRTIKTAFGVVISSFLAQRFHLEFYSTAAILTVLCLQVTKKQTILTALQRAISCVIGMGLCVLLFSLFGFSYLGLLMTVLLIIPLLLRLKIKEGFVTSTVIILHIFTLGDVSVPILANELGLIAVGVGVALLLNLFMPNLNRELEERRKSIDRNFSVILHEFAVYLRQGESDWQGKEFLDTEELLLKAKQLAQQDAENHLFRHDPYYEQYFSMREKQFELLERMMPIVSTLSQRSRTGLKLADFLERLSKQVGPHHRAHLFLNELRDMRRENKKAPLPSTREEFETRASVFYLFNEIERYLIIKDEFSKLDQKRQRAKK